MIRLSVLTLTMFAAAAPANAAEPKTAAAVIAADKAWGDAEAAGNAAFVEQLLLPGYLSVNDDGKVVDKAKIVAHTRTRDKQAQAKLAAARAEWKATHPERPDVTIVGDTAILKWVSVKAGAGEPIYSCDIFVYRGGRWHAIYSQHTTAGS